MPPDSPTATATPAPIIPGYGVAGHDEHGNAIMAPTAGGSGHAAAPAMSAVENTFMQANQSNEIAERNWNYLAQHPDSPEFAKRNIDPTALKWLTAAGMGASKDTEASNPAEGPQISPTEKAIGEGVASGGLGGIAGAATGALANVALPAITKELINKPVTAITGSQKAGDMVERGAQLGLMGAGVMTEMSGGNPTALDDTATPTTPTKAPDPLANPQADEALAGKVQPDQVAPGAPVKSPEQLQGSFTDKLVQIFDQNTDAVRHSQSNATSTAKAQDIDPDFFTRMFGAPDVALNPEQHVALAQFASSKANEIVGMSRDLLKEPDADLRSGKLTSEIIPRITALAQLNVVKDNTTKIAGQSLQIMNMLKGINEQSGAVSSTLERMLKSDPTSWEDAIRGLAALPRSDQAADAMVHALRDNNGAGFESSKFVRYLTNAALTSPTLAGRKLLTDALTNVTRIPAYSLSSMINPQDFPPGMDVSQAVGLVQGFGDALKIGYIKSMWKGSPEWSKANGARGVFGSDDLGETLGTAIDYTGAMSFGRRNIMAMGEFQKALAYRANLNAQAWKMGVQKATQDIPENGIGNGVGRLSAAVTNMRALLKSVPDILHNKALNMADMDAYTNAPGPAAQQFQKVVQSFHPLGIPLGRMGMLFFRTPLALEKAEIAHTPIGYISAARGQDLMGNALNSEQRTLAFSRATVGSGIMAYAFYHHAQGLITGGGPGNPVLRKQWMETHQPYSIKGPDGNWHSYSGCLPLRMSMGLASDLADIHAQMPDPDAQHAVGMVSSAIGRSVMHMPFMDLITTLGDYLTQAQQGEEASLMKSGGDFLSRLAIPAVAGADAQFQTPLHLQAQNFLDEWKEKIPGWSKEVTPERNIFGEPHYIGGGYTPADAPGPYMKLNNLLSPVESGKTMAEHDPLSWEIERVIRQTGWNPAKAPRALDVDGKGLTGGKPDPSNETYSLPSNTRGMTLNAQQWDRLQVLSGTVKDPISGLNKHDLMLKTIQDPEYAAAPDAYKERRLSLINHAFNQSAIYHLANEDPSVLPGLKTMLQQRAANMQQGRNVPLGHPDNPSIKMNVGTP